MRVYIYSFLNELCEQFAMLHYAEVNITTEIPIKKSRYPEV